MRRHRFILTGRRGWATRALVSGLPAPAWRAAVLKGLTAIDW